MQACSFLLQLLVENLIVSTTPATHQQHCYSSLLHIPSLRPSLCPAQVWPPWVGANRGVMLPPCLLLSLCGSSGCIWGNGKRREDQPPRRRGGAANVGDGAVGVGTCSSYYHLWSNYFYVSIVTPSTRITFAVVGASLQ